MEFELSASNWMDRDKVLAAVRKAKMPRLKKCGYLVEAEMKRLLSKGDRQARTKTQHKDGSAKTAAGSPSAPGEAPHLQTGNMRASVQSAETSEETVVVGTTSTAWYGRVHEFGGKNHAKRPFARPSLMNMAEQFPQQFGGLDLGGV